MKVQNLIREMKRKDGLSVAWITGGEGAEPKAKDKRPGSRSPHPKAH